MAVARNIDKDWRVSKSLPECMLYVLKNEIMCDVTFQVGYNKKPIRAHKFMLCTRSPVFHTMFEGSLPEKGVISIPDIEESTFHSLLQYIYSDNLSVTNDNVKEMLYVSDKYMITTLKWQCETVLQMSSTTTDVAKSLQTAFDYKLDNLLKQSISYIEENTTHCLSSKHTLNLSKECLELILKSEYLNCTETELCSFFLKWTERQCELTNVEANGQNMRTIAGNLLLLVRFPLVDSKVFTKDISTTSILTMSETLSIYQFNCGLPVEDFPFSNRIRQPVSEREIFKVTRLASIPISIQSTGVRTLKFKANKDIWLKGIIIGSPVQNNPVNFYSQGDPQLSNSIRIKVLSTDDHLLSSFQTIVKCVIVSRADEYKTTEVKVPEPLKILHSRNYTITMEGMKANSIFCHYRNPGSISGVDFIFEEFPQCAGRNNGTQDQYFAGLIFSLDEIFGHVDWKYSIVHQQNLLKY